MLKEFRQFIMRGNVLDLAIAVIIGVAFGAIVKSLVDDILMPPIGLLLGNVDFADLFVVLKAGNVPGPYGSLAAAKEAAAVTWRYGAFINTVINFLIVALAMFIVIKLAARAMRRDAAQPVPPSPTSKECPQCTMQVPLRAVRCPHCTSDIRG
jgi:large conductance mechanosensitive channel